MEQLVQSLTGTNILVVGVLASLVAGSMAAVGALPLAFVGEISQRSLNPMLGFAAGVMLAARRFSAWFSPASRRRAAACTERSSW